MRLIQKNIDRVDGPGSVRVHIEDSEDIWHIYNLIKVGHVVRTSTVRKIKNESSSGSVSTSRKRLTLSIEVRP